MDIEKGQYTPVPLLMILKSKPGKKEKRPIAINSALDQMLQHCIRYETERYFTSLFHSDSYGFIRGRNTAQAINKCLEYMNHGKFYVVDADIRKCFDSIKHHVVIQELGKASSDRRVAELVKKFLKNPGLLGNHTYHHRVGVWQGSCLSPVLANVVLNQLDWYLDRQDISFVRYADDLILFLNTEDEAWQARAKLEVYLRKKLSLSLSQEKTSVLPAQEARFLGYSFLKDNDRYILQISDKEKEKMLSQMRKCFNLKSTTDLLDRIGAFNRGWLGYYGKVRTGEMAVFLDEADAEELEIILRKLHRAGETSKFLTRDILSSVCSVTDP